MNNYNLENFRDDLSKFGIVLSEAQEKQFIRYYELLVEWNEFMNLTAITEWNEVLKKHFVDSVSLIQLLPEVKDKELLWKDVKAYLAKLSAYIEMPFSSSSKVFAHFQDSCGLLFPA